MTPINTLREVEAYSDGSKYTMCREYGETPNGNPLHGEWVLRCNGEFVDFDKYRYDLAERNGLELDDSPAQDSRIRS